MENKNQPGRAGDEERGGNTSSPLVHRTDLMLAVIILTVCGALYYATTFFEEVPAVLSQNITPEMFPRLLIWTIVFLTLLIPFEHKFAEKGKSLDDDRKRKIRPMAYITGALLCAIVALSTIMGTTLTMVLVCVLLPILWGERRPKVLIPYAIIFPGAVSLLFSEVLKVYFEPGIFGFVLH